MPQNNPLSQKLNVRDAISRVERLRFELMTAEAELTKHNIPKFNFKDILDNVREMIYVLNASGIVSYVNSHFLEWTGFSEADVLGSYFGDFLGDDQRVEIEGYYFNQIQSREPNSYREFPIKVKDGELRWVGQNVRMYFEGDILKCVYVSARDVTAQRQLRDLLKSSEEKYRGIIEHMKLGLMEVDLDGNIIWMNHSFTALTGYELQEVKGENARKLMVPQNLSEELEKQEELRMKGEAGLYETKVKHKTGDFRDLIISGAPIFDAKGEVIGSIGIHFDVTETRKTELELIEARQKAEQAQLAEKEFLASMSHEIRTPLNAIIGMSHLLTESELNKEQEVLLTSIYYSANLLRGLINDILDFSKIEAGQLDIRYDSTDLNRLVSSCIQMISHGMEKENVELIYCAPNNLPDRLFTDAVLINQVVTNLLSNAIKFTYSGTIKVELSAEQFGDKWIIRIDVADTGIGIPEDKIDLVFDKFKQIGERQGGTGLGLAICKKVVESLSGTIDVTSKVNEGSTFTVKIPMEIAAVTDQNQNFKNVSQPSECHILVVDDNDMNVQYLTRVLEKHNIGYDCARDGLEALELTAKQRYNLIFMDVQMPRLNGLEATVRIRSNARNLNHETPIIGLSAYAFSEDVQLSARAGMDDYLTKPFAPSDVFRVISKYIFPEYQPGSYIESAYFHEELDHEVLQNLYEGDVQYALDMFEIYLNQFGEYLNDLQACIVRQDSKSICAELHKIRSPLRMVGLTLLAKDSESLERDLTEKGFTHVIKLKLNKLTREIVGSDYMIKESIVKMKETLNSEL